jgi:hypothetical protein
VQALDTETLRLGGTAAGQRPDPAVNGRARESSPLKGAARTVSPLQGA